MLRALHPFPSALDAIATAAIAHVAGATTSTALALAAGMLFLQFAIGLANDIVDAPSDVATRSDNPIAAGDLSADAARVVSAVCAAIGLGVAAWVGPIALALGLVGLADGLLYDMRLKGTAWSWLAFALGVGVLPVYAWSGTTGCLAAPLALVFVLAVAAGAALAVGNALSDAEVDAQAGLATIAVVLGQRRAVALDCALTFGVQLTVAASLVVSTPSALALAAAAAGFFLGWIGLGVTALANGRRREMGWELQAVGIALAGAAWAQVLAAGFLSRTC